MQTLSAGVYISHAEFISEHFFKFAIKWEIFLQNKHNTIRWVVFSADIWLFLRYFEECDRNIVLKLTVLISKECGQMDARFSRREAKINVRFELMTLERIFP